MPSEELTKIYLSRNWGGDHYVLTFVPPLSPVVMISLKRDLEIYSGLGSWGTYNGENETRLTRHNDLGGDEGLLKMANFACDTLIEMYEVNSIVVDSHNILKTQDGTYGLVE